MDLVTEVLEKQAKELEKYKPISVEKHLELEFDEGTLLALDKNDLDSKALKQNINDYILNLTRDNTQLLINKLWELPVEKIDEIIVAKLPPPKFVLPREKPVPKPRIPTKWQQFAKEKGIVKKKKSKLNWDEQLQKWVPLYGYKKAAAEKDKQWLIEVPQNADPLEDQFEKQATKKSERVAKNELQRLRNIAKSKNIKLPRMGITDVGKESSKTLGAAVSIAKASTASLGKFQEKLPKEKDPRGINSILPGSSRKRKLPPIPGKLEKAENQKIVEAILNKKPTIDITKAVNRKVGDGFVERSEETRTVRPTTANKKKAGRNKTGKKPKGGKGQKNINKKSGGRKRR